MQWFQVERRNPLPPNKPLCKATEISNFTIANTSNTNIVFATALGRQLTGAEAATIQGTDLSLVETARLSESLLTDMCGNEMSSTVVLGLFYSLPLSTLFYQLEVVHPLVTFT